MWLKRMLAHLIESQTKRKVKGVADTWGRLTVTVAADNARSLDIVTNNKKIKNLTKKWMEFCHRQVLYTSPWPKISIPIHRTGVVVSELLKHCIVSVRKVPTIIHLTICGVTAPKLSGVGRSVTISDSPLINTRVSYQEGENRTGIAFR